MIALQSIVYQYAGIRSPEDLNVKTSEKGFILVIIFSRRKTCQHCHAVTPFSKTHCLPVYQLSSRCHIVYIIYK